VLKDVLPQFGQDGVVIPGPGADKVLHGFAFAVAQIGERFGGPALQLAELALPDHLG